MRPSCLCVVIFFWVLSYAEFSNGENEACSHEGQEFSTNDVHYKCINGALVPVACASTTGVKVAIGETYETSGYEMRCTQLASNWIQMVPIACMHDGKRMAPSETFIDQSFWYTCVRKNETVVIELSGCVGDKGDKVGSGQNFHSGDFVFKCIRLATGGITVQPVACVANQTEIPIGQSWMEKSFYFVCNRKGDTGIEKGLGGCVYEDKKFEVGQKYTKNGFIYKCERTSNGGVSHTVVGCLGPDNKEHYVNDRWTEGTPPFRFVFECYREHERIMKKIVQCSYEGVDGQAVIDPGCMKKVGSNFVQCLSRGANGVQYKLSGNSTVFDGVKLC